MQEHETNIEEMQFVSRASYAVCEEQDITFLPRDFLSGKLEASSGTRHRELFCRLDSGREETISSIDCLMINSL